VERPRGEFALLGLLDRSTQLTDKKAEAPSAEPLTCRAALKTTALAANGEYEWDECKRVQGGERSAIQLIYVPASRDAATQVTALLKGRLWQAAKWSAEFRTNTANTAVAIQTAFEREEPLRFVIERLTKRWNQVHPSAVPPVDSQLEHHSDKSEFCSDLNKLKGCELSECLLRPQQKFEDFQAEYEGSIPFTRSTIFCAHSSLIQVNVPHA
jgi:hypothetical protein